MTSLEISKIRIPFVGCLWREAGTRATWAAAFLLGKTENNEIIELSKMN